MYWSPAPQKKPLVVEPCTSFVPTIVALLPTLPFALPRSLKSKLALLVAGYVKRAIALWSVEVSSVVIVGEPLWTV